MMTERKKREVRQSIRRGLRMLGREAVTMAALFTMGARRTAARISSPCGCFLGEIVCGLNGEFEKWYNGASRGMFVEEQVSVNAAAVSAGVAVPYPDPISLDPISVIYWAHADSPSGSYTILHEEVEKYLGFSVQELQDTVELPSVVPAGISAGGAP